MTADRPSKPSSAWGVVEELRRKLGSRRQDGSSFGPRRASGQSGWRPVMHSEELARRCAAVIGDEHREDTAGKPTDGIAALCRTGADSHPLATSHDGELASAG